MAATNTLSVSKPILDAKFSVATTGNTFTTPLWIDVGAYEQVRYIIPATLGTTNTMTALINQATSSAGAGSKAISGKALTTITNGTSSASVLAQIGVKGTDCDINNGFHFVQCSVTIGILSNANVVGIYCEGTDVRTAPAVGDISTQIV